MRVRDLMTPAPITVSPETSVVEARALMTEARVRHLPVVRDGQLVGIVTDRDIRLNLPSPATSLSAGELNYLLARLPVEQTMTSAVITVDPQRSVREAGQIMLDHKIGSLPVLEQGRLVGILTETDFLRGFVQTASLAGR
jgi:CBS domain-containing protein